MDLLRKVRKEEGHAEFLFWELNEALDKIQIGKAGGRDHLQGEFIARLGVYERERLLQLFNERLHGGARPTSWENPIVVLLAKMPKATWIKNVRPITITSILARTYDRLLLAKIAPSQGIIIATNLEIGQDTSAVKLFMWCDDALRKRL